VTNRVELRAVAKLLRGVSTASLINPSGADRFFGSQEVARSGQGQERRVDVDSGDRKIVRLEPGDVVVVVLGRIGWSTLISDDDSGAVLGRECVVLRSVSDELSPPWLYSWTLSPEFANQVQRHASGASLARLSPRDLNGFTLPLPSLGYQQQVEDDLQRFRTAIQATSRTLGVLEALEGLELTRVFADLQQ